MIIVIIAGGSGTRLWPLSTQEYPKQLLTLVGDKSMVQETYDRAKKLTKKIYVVPDISHAEHIKRQLPDIDDDHLIIEPGRKGTANCILAALSQIRKKEDNNEPVAFISTDHHIRDIDGFQESFQTASDSSVNLHSIVLVGVEPNYPATGFGYIERGEKSNYPNTYKVKSFKEKPDYATAKKYIKTGKFLWNSGYFVGSTNVFLDTMKKYAPDLLKSFEILSEFNQNSEKFKNVYSTLANNSIDYALIEKSKDLNVVPASFDWADIGSFKDLHDVVEKDENQNYSYGEDVYILDSENVYVRNEEVKPVVVIGLDNVVVVNTKDGILVTRKDASQKVGDIAKKIQA